MANEEQLEILKQGVEVWNKWREDNPNVNVDLSKAILTEAKLDSAKLSGANLWGANLSQALLAGANLTAADLTAVNLTAANLTAAKIVATNLLGADLSIANIFGANLGSSNLEHATLKGASLKISNLNGANLRGANLEGTDLWRASLAAANLTEANLTDANLTEADLEKADLTNGKVGRTVLADNYLDSVIGLKTLRHFGPSLISINTIRQSKGKIPIEFLRGCGLSDFEIEFAKLANPDLSSDEITDITYKIHEFRAGGRSIQVSPLFISYSHIDNVFVEKMEGKLNEKGIRFWRDIHDMKSGRVETQIDRAINLNPTVLLVLSEHSSKSDWVEHEVRTARELEKELGRDTLCPVALDDSWKDSPWPKRVMEQVMEYNILDFSEWEDDVKFERMFRRLIDGLELFYKG